jgi:hypothetical protein
MRQTHAAGEKLFVDFAGDTIAVFDAVTGEARECKIFVAVLGASNYTYVEARFREALPEWICSRAGTRIWSSRRRLRQRKFQHNSDATPQSRCRHMTQRTFDAQRHVILVCLLSVGIEAACLTRLALFPSVAAGGDAWGCTTYALGFP